MTVGWHRPTKLTIDLAAIEANVRQELACLPEQTEIFAVVKANAYGHGAVPCAQAAKAGGATGFCVAMLDEALELRQAGFKEPILILGPVNSAYIELLLAYELSVTVISHDWLIEAQQQMQQLTCEKPLKVHLKVDSGMSRIGFTTFEELTKAVELLQHDSAFLWEGLFTHFATADEEASTVYQRQVTRFQEVLAALPTQPPYIHVSNSANALYHEPVLGNMVRLGVAMYGLNPAGNSTALQPTYPLQPALSLTSQLIQVKQVAAGESVGYGATYTTTTDEWIGTLPIGYADGWLRKLQGFEVLIDGEYCPIIGRVCMDQCMVRLPKEMAVGTEVTLIGTQKEQQITLQMVADYLGTIHYEVACTFSQRLPRKYE